MNGAGLCHRRLRRQCGAVVIEFALLAIPLFVVVFGIVDFGRMMFEYQTIAKSARDAARLLSTQTPSDPDYPALVTRATNLAVYGNPAGTGSPLLSGLTTAMVSICDPSTCPGTHATVTTGSGVINLVTVTIGTVNTPYVFQTLAPFTLPSFSFAPISVTMAQVI